MCDKRKNSEMNSIVRTKDKRRKFVAASKKQLQRPTRQRKKPDRYGKRKSAADRDSFFGEMQIHNNSEDVESNSSHEDVITNLLNAPCTPTSQIIISESESIVNDSSQIISSEPESPAFMPLAGSISPQITSNSNSNTRSSLPFDFETVVIQKLDEILKRISALEKSSAKSDARLRGLEKALDQFDCSSGSSSPELSHSERSKFGLPILSQMKLDKLENDLTDNSFKTKLVSHFLVILVCNHLCEKNFFA